MKLAPALALLCLPLLMACEMTPASEGTQARGPTMGGSAGQMGMNYCHTVPADKNARWQWNRLCFPNSR